MEGSNCHLQTQEGRIMLLHYCWPADSRGIIPASLQQGRKTKPRHVPGSRAARFSMCCVNMGKEPFGRAKMQGVMGRLGQYKGDAGESVARCNLQGSAASFTYIWSSGRGAACAIRQYKMGSKKPNRAFWEGKPTPALLSSQQHSGCLEGSGK